MLLVVLAIRRQRFPSSARVWALLAGCTVISNIVPFALFAWGEQRISSSRAGVLNATTPLCTLLFAMALLPDERPTTNKVTGLLVGFAGVVVLVAPWADRGSGAGASDLAGQMACIGAAASYGIAFVYTRRFLSVLDLPAGVLAAGQLAAGTVLLLVAAPFVAAQPVDLTARVVLSILALGGLGTGIAYLIFHGLVRDAGATSTSTVTYLIPVTAVILGVVVLGESVSWNLFVGAAIIIAGVALAEGRIPRLQPKRSDERRATMLRRT